MASQSEENCSMCAYAMKSGSKIWCPFHDLQVPPKAVCDDFLDEFQSPKWISLAAGMNETSDPIPQYLTRDRGFYILTFVLWLIAAYFVVYFSFVPL